MLTISMNLFIHDSDAILFKCFLTLILIHFFRVFERKFVDFFQNHCENR